MSLPEPPVLGERIEGLRPPTHSPTETYCLGRNTQNLGPKYGFGDWSTETWWIHWKIWNLRKKNAEIVVKHTNLEVVETHE